MDMVAEVLSTINESVLCSFTLSFKLCFVPSDSNRIHIHAQLESMLFTFPVSFFYFYFSWGMDEDENHLNFKYLTSSERHLEVNEQLRANEKL